MLDEAFLSILCGYRLGSLEVDAVCIYLDDLSAVLLDGFGDLLDDRLAGGGNLLRGIGVVEVERSAQVAIERVDHDLERPLDALPIRPLGLFAGFRLRFCLEAAIRQLFKRR